MKKPYAKTVAANTADELTNLINNVIDDVLNKEWEDGYNTVEVKPCPNSSNHFNYAAILVFRD